MAVSRARIRPLQASFALILLFLFLLFAPPGASAFAAGQISIPAFHNLTGEEQLDWIGEGFARTLVEKLNVIAELSAELISARKLYTPEGDLDLPHLLKSDNGLMMGIVLYGSIVKGADVDRLDDPLEITIRIVDVRTTEQLAAMELRGFMRQIFSMEADLALKVAGLFNITLSPAEEQLLHTHATRSLVAYKETILGTLYIEDGKFDAAIDILGQAMEHHPGLFYPKAHNLLARAYMLSGKKEEMLKRFKKDAASLASVYYNLAVAQEFNGDIEEARKNLGLFLKYTDHRTLHWRKKIPGIELEGGAIAGVVLRDGRGTVRSLDWKSGTESPAAAVDGGRDSAIEGITDEAKLIPPEERGRIVAGPVRGGDRLYYGLDNGYLIGRSATTGTRTWSYRLQGIPSRRIVPGPGTLAVSDSRGFVYSLGTEEGSEPTDLSAYLKLADLARRHQRTEDAEDLYRHVVEEVKFNVPSAWHALWKIAKERDDKVVAAYRWDRYQEAQY